jgi:hypothetical protein
MPSTKSGGRKALDKEAARKAAEAKEHAAWNRADLRAFAALPKHSDDALGAYQEAVDALRLVVRRAARNPALYPQQRHEMVGRHAAGLAKAAGPLQIIADLDARLRKALDVIESLEVKLRGARQSTRDSGAAGAPIEH